MTHRQELSGRVAVVTGGTRGVGAGIVGSLLAAGAVVVAAARRPPTGAIGSAGGKAEFRALDVRDPEAGAALLAQVAADHGRLDLLVNNAGGTPYLPLAEGDAERHRRILELNLIAPLLLSRAAHAVMREQSDGGSIVMIGSVSGSRPSPGSAAYGAAKAGLDHLARSLAVEWAPLLLSRAAHAVMREQPDGGSIVMIGSVSGSRPSPGSAAYGAAKAGLDHLARSLAVEWAPLVRVNTLVLGMVRTEASALHYGDEEGVAAVGRTVPLGRLAEPEEVGEAVVFLASPRAGYISGASLLLHGGGERPAFLDAATANR